MALEIVHFELDWSAMLTIYQLFHLGPGLGSLGAGVSCQLRMHSLISDACSARGMCSIEL